MTFKALLSNKTGDVISTNLVDFNDEDLMPGDVTVAIEYSTVNYKDAMALSGRTPVIRQFPLIPGIDFAGIMRAAEANMRSGEISLIYFGGRSEEVSWVARDAGALFPNMTVIGNVMEGPVTVKGLPEKDARSIGMDLRPWVEAGLLRIVATRATACGLELHLASIHKLIREFGPRAIVIDPISNMITVGSRMEVKAMLTRLIDRWTSITEEFSGQQ
mgnify:CR=1 FL=1